MNIIAIIDWVVFVILALCAGYLLFYAIASLFYCDETYATTESRQRFLVLFPAYAEDGVIVHAVETFLQQDYPQEFYHVVVISDHQQETTNAALRMLPVTTLIATYDNSSKAKALTFAIDSVEGDFDTVVVLDADNLAPSNFLSELNKIRHSGAQAIQVHRKGLIGQTGVSLLDALSEEVNNAFFRKGHQAVHLSSALTGSGMAFDYHWFAANIRRAVTAGEDKELEAMLLKQRIKVTYVDELYVWDKKTDRSEAMGNQRKRWIAAQFHTMTASLPDFFSALFTGNMSYADKILQWMLPPRLIQLALIFGLTLIILIIYPSAAVKWVILSLAQIAAMILPLPKEYRTKGVLKAFALLPAITWRMFVNLFHLRGASSKFIHTKHT
jgi:cellulose synthase/poly-beta-1,6-N-acetylglucosamine synthase-like glycosyltransferase